MIVVPGLVERALTHINYIRRLINGGEICVFERAGQPIVKKVGGEARNGCSNKWRYKVRARVAGAAVDLPVLDIGL